VGSELCIRDIYLSIYLSIYLRCVHVSAFLFAFLPFFWGFIYEFICSYQNGGFSDFVPIRKPSYQPVLWFLHRRSEAFYTGNPLPGGVLDASGGPVFFLGISAKIWGFSVDFYRTVGDFSFSATKNWGSWIPDFLGVPTWSRWIMRMIITLCSISPKLIIKQP
jgi:hypothetical protein